MIIASLEYIHKLMISLNENDFFSTGKMQIHVRAMLEDNDRIKTCHI